MFGSTWQRFRFEYLYKKYREQGKLIEFNQEFYDRFEDMYYNGLPIYYYLEKMSMGKCYDASAILSLAMGKESYVCRGELANMTIIYDDEDGFGHGWVEVGDMVYDTTWKIMCSKKVYNQLFKPIDVSRRSHEQFFEDCKEMSDWTIRSKKWYEENFSMSNLLIFQVEQIERLKLSNPNISEESKAFSNKVLSDLPKYKSLCDVEVIKK